MSVDHYENFPVASLLLPANLRPAVEAIYRFARSADDSADEGEQTNEERIHSLQEYEAELAKIEAGVAPSMPIFIALVPVIREFKLPLRAFYDLLSAFKQDVSTKRYPTYSQLLDYCARSANPVGLLMLHLYRRADVENSRASDAICSALQIINFLQDIGIDWQKQRIYIPQEDLIKFNVTEQHISDQLCDRAWRNLMQFETQRARELMLSGATLARMLPGRIGWELRLVVQGGLRIIEKIDHANGDVFRHRPKLGKRDWLILGWRALWM
jgi:squalene synthase HpnC